MNKKQEYIDKINQIRSNLGYEVSSDNNMTKGDVLKTLFEIFYEIKIIIQKPEIHNLIKKSPNSINRELVEHLTIDLFQRKT